MSKFFITRPIFASVLSIIIVLAGLAAALKLPIAQYPQISPPTVLVTATYPGASADTLSKTVAAPIEEQLSGVEGLLYFNSSADSSGTLTITATFEVGTDINQATFNVSNRVNIALPRLPDEVRRTGLVVQKRSNDILLVVMLTDKQKKYDPLYLSNYGTLNVLDELKRIQGVGDAIIFGAQDYSMRIWLRPDRMAQLGVTTSDIANAIRTQNAQYAAGKIGQDPSPSSQQLVYTVTAKGRLIDPSEFGNIIIRADGPRGVLYLKDVARIELGSQSYNVRTSLNGLPGVGIPIFLQSGANALDTAKAVKDRMAELKQRFPEGIDWEVPYDTSDFVKSSIIEVVKTLGEAMLLVVLVVFLFLQSWRATLIPLIAVPISLIGTFAGLWMFGFSINTLTLFAMVLSIGIVVDDAIVVLENVERLMTEENLSPMKAAIKSMEQVSAAIVAIVLVLGAVFIPVAFLGGIAGEMYRQFAVTVAVAVMISGVVALTLTPALCAVLLKSAHEKSGFFKAFNNAFTRLTHFYTATVNLTLHHKIIGTLVFAAIIALVVVLLRTVPGSFVPPEDQGYVISAVIMPDGATLSRTSKTTENVRSAIAKDPAVAHQFVVNGFDLIGGGNKTSAATMFVRLTDWAERTTTADDIVGKLFGIGMQQPDGLAIAFNPPAIRGLGSSGGFEMYVQSRNDASPAKLSAVVNNFIGALKNEPRLADINTFFRPTVPQLFVEVDEAKAISQGVPVADIYATLQSTMGSLYVNDFNKSGRTYRVQLQAEAEYRMKADDLGKVYVRSNSGQMVPLSALSKVSHIVGAEQLERYNGLLSAKVLGKGALGVSSGDAIQMVEKVAAQNLPDGYQIAWTGQAYQEKRTGSAAVFAFAFAIIMVFLILAAQFETWALPLAVIMAVPFALAGALLAVLMRGMPNDIYFQIGLITLVGLAAKNAILIVEFASQKMEEGMPVAQAALEAARLRFRPIVMTSMAFVLGIVPLVIATGAGAAARRSMGTGVFGGMLLATFVATIFIPLFFTWLSNKNVHRKHHDVPEDDVNLPIDASAKDAKVMPSCQINSLKPICVVMAVLFFTGCQAVGPDYQRPVIDIPTKYVEAGQDNQQPSKIINNWWTLYQDQALNDLLEKALKNNTDIKLAVARIEEADAVMREVGAFLLPQIDLDATAKRSRVTEAGANPLFANNPRNNFNLQLGSTFELDFWGKLRRAKESARAQALSSRYAKDTVALSLSGLVVGNYLLHRSLQSQITIVENNLKSRDASLILTQHRLEGGVASALDLHQAEAASANLSAQLFELTRLQSLNLHQLAVLTGDLDLSVRGLNVSTIADEVLPVPPSPPAGLPSSLLETRPDVRQAEEAMIAANANIGVAKAALYPSISLTAALGGESLALSDILKSSARIWTGGINLYLPIFDSGKLNAKVDQVSAKQKQALANYEGVIQNAFREVNDALVNFRQQTARESALLKAQDSAKKALDIAENRYQSGYSGYIDVLDAQRVSNEAGLAYVQSRQARLIASVDLFKALGGGWQAETE